MFCPCDGMELDSRFPYHFEEPCKCEDCTAQPNYCAQDGAYIGTVEYATLHKLEAHQEA